MTIAIYTQKKDLDTFLYLSRFISELDKKKIQTIIYAQSAKDLQFAGNFKTFSCKEDLLEHGVELLFTFGGDGTIVNSLVFIEDSKIPIVGVNTGRLGFLSSFTKEEIFTQLDNVLSGNTQISPRSVMEVTSPKGLFFPYALNDIVINRRETTSMITVDFYMNQKFLNVFWGDGVIISTPTGSTAYSMSCGGPIISPDNENFIITPIAPHNLNIRPLVVNDKAEFKLKIDSRVAQYSLSLDSRIIHIDTSVEVCIRRADFKIYLIQPLELSFYDTIRQKLLWGQDKRN